MTESDAVALGEIIRAARQTAGLSTPALAREVGVNQSSIVRLEQGKFAKPSPDLLQRLADALNVSLSDLYTLAGIPLPTLQPYLRGKYGLSEEATLKVAAYIEQLMASGEDRSTRTTSRNRRPPGRQKGGNSSQ